MIQKFKSLTRLAMGLVLVGGLAACGAPTNGALESPVSRDIPADGSLESVQVQPALRSYTVAEINVRVPRTLKVSERNSFYPGGDIVWREDPIGDRHQQVAAIIHAGLSKGAAQFDGMRPVILDIEVERFHALTEKARYTVGGVHAISFKMRVRDAQTGEVLEAPRLIKADFPGLGGMAAIAAEQRGITQKVRITDQLAYVIEQELGTSEGYRAQSNELIGAINQL